MDSYTKLLLKCDGDLLDSSGEGNDFSADGAVTFSAAIAHSGQSAHIGTDYGICLRGPVVSDFQFGMGAFTITIWAVIESFGSRNAFFELNSFSTGIYFDCTSEYLQPHYFNTGTYHQVPWTQATGELFRIDLVRDEFGTVYLFHQGNLLDSWVDTANLQPSLGTNNFVVGNCAHDLGRNLRGYIDDFEVSPGIARYTESFNPEDLPFGRYHLLLHLDGNWADATNRNGSFSPGGNATFSSNTKKWGQAVYFPLSGGGWAQRLETSHLRIDDDQFMLDCWVMPTHWDQYYNYRHALLSWGASSDDDGGWALGVHGGQSEAHTVYVWNNNVETPLTAETSTELALNELAHVRLAKDYDTLRIFLNGICRSETTGWDGVAFHAGTADASARYVRLAAAWSVLSGEIPFVGYMDEVRLYRGQTQTADFTPPTEPFADLAVVRLGGDRCRMGYGSWSRRGGDLAAQLRAYSRRGGDRARVYNSWSRLGGDRARITYEHFVVRRGDQFSILRGWSRLGGGLYRQAADVAGYLAWIGDGESPDLTAAPDVVSAELPLALGPLAPAPAGQERTYRVVVRRRNQWGLVSQNTDELILVVGDDGAVQPDRPRAAEAVAAVPVAGGAVRLTASYNYPADGALAADRWLLWLTTDGSDPDPETSPTVLTMRRLAGVARLDYSTAAQAEGTVVKALVATRRSGTGGADSLASNIVSATATLSGPAAGPVSVHLLGLAELAAVAAEIPERQE